MINENIATGKWQQLKGQIQKSWGKLSGNELEETKGDITKIVGLVQQRYGEAQEVIREKINSFLSEQGNKEKPSKASENCSMPQRPLN